MARYRITWTHSPSIDEWDERQMGGIKWENVKTIERLPDEPQAPAEIPIDWEWNNGMGGRDCPLRATRGIFSCLACGHHRGFSYSSPYPQEKPHRSSVPIGYSLIDGQLAEKASHVLCAKVKP